MILLYVLAVAALFHEVLAGEPARRLCQQRKPLPRRPRRPYDLRHACVTTWLNATGDPAQVAAWPGHSVNDLLRVNIRCVAGRDELAKKRIEQALAKDLDDQA